MPYTFFWMLVCGVFLGGGALATKLSATGSKPMLWLGMAFLGYTISYSLFYGILRSQPVSMVSPAVQATSILTTALVAVLIMGESLTLTRLLAYALILRGLCLLAKT